MYLQSIMWFPAGVPCGGARVENPKASRSVQPFYRADGRNKHTDTQRDIETDRATYRHV